MVIGIDIDDTIAATTEIIDIYAKEYTENVLNRKFKINRVDTYDPMWAKSVYDWTEEEDKRFWNLYYEKVMKNVKPKENAVKIINELFNQHRIIIVTARWEKNTNAKKITETWLKKNNIHYHKLYLNYQDKKELIKEIKIELFIDDSVKFCEDMENLGIKTFIMSSRINKEINTGKAIRVKNWIEIYEKICTNEDK